MKDKFASLKSLRIFCPNTDKNVNIKDFYIKGWSYEAQEEYDYSDSGYDIEINKCPACKKSHFIKG